MSNQQRTFVSNNDISLLYPSNDTFSIGVNLELGWDENYRTITNSLGDDVVIPLADSYHSGLLSVSDFDKLQTISEYAEPNRSLSELNNLGIDATTVNTFTVESSVPPNAVFTDTTYQIEDGGLTEINFTIQRRDKLIGIENGAERNRTITELNQLNLDAKTVNGFSIESSVPPNAVFTDTTYSNLSEFQNDVGYVTNSALDDFETSTELNQRDQNNRKRSNHTGLQDISTIKEISLTSLLVGEVLKYDGTYFTNLPLFLTDISGTGELAALDEITNSEIAAGADIELSKLEINPLDRANHTGTQSISTIEEFDLSSLDAGDFLLYDGVNISGKKLGLLAELDEITNSEVATGADIELSKLATNPLERSNHTGSQSISTINEIDLTSLNPGEVLKYDGTDFTNSILELADITDSGVLAGLNKISNNEIVTNADIELSKLATNPLERSNHTGTQPFPTISEVVLTTLNPGEVLKYDGTYFTNVTLGLADISDSGLLAGLSEITNSEVAIGADIELSKLEIDPLARSNHTGTQPFSTISEVVLTTLSPGEVLRYNGTNITNSILDLNDISDSGILAELDEITNSEVAVGADIELSKLATDPLLRSNHKGSQSISTINEININPLAPKEVLKYDGNNFTNSILELADISNSGILAGLDEITNSEVAVGAGIELSKLETDPLARANHTGTQPISTIAEINLTTLTSGQVLQYNGNDIVNTTLGLTDISDSGGLAGLDEITNSEVATGAGIELSKLATNPLERVNHTGTQPISTIEEINLTTLTAGQVLRYDGNDITNENLRLIDIVDSGALAGLDKITNNEVAAGADISLSKLITDPLARANHTGTQPISTIAEINLTTLTSGQVLQYNGNDITNTTLELTDISDSGGLAGLDEITNSEVATGANIELSKLEIDPLARANHTGTQPISTIAEINLTTLTSGQVLQYDGNSITNSTLELTDISDSGGLAGLDKITNSEVATGANIELSKLETDPLARSNHTGTQPLSTISDSGNSAIRNITGIDNLVCSGTAGVGGNVAQWNSDGDVVDAGIATSNVLLNVVEDKTPQLGGTLDAQQEVIRDYTSNIIKKTGTNETALLEYTGNILELDNYNEIIFTLPNSLPEGWRVRISQTNKGPVRFIPDQGAILHNNSSHERTGGRWATVFLYVTSNSNGTSAEYILSGDTS